MNHAVSTSKAVGAFAVAFLILISSCKKGTSTDTDASVNPGDTSITGLPPVETAAKVAPDQQPAFSGQNRVAGVKTKATYKTSILTSSLNHP